MAQKLAEKLGLVKPAPVAAPSAPMAGAVGAVGAADAATADASPDAAGTATQDPAGADAPTPQEELDQQIASAFLAQDETELQLEAAQLQTEAGSTPVFADLDDARAFQAK